MAETSPSTTAQSGITQPGIALAAHRLSCAIGRSTILTDIGFEIPTGAMVAFIGPNGSGKSTLLSTLSGLRPAQSGTVMLEGHDLTQLSGRQRARRLAVVKQNEEPPADLLVGEVVALGLVPHRLPWSGGGADETDAVARALDLMQMGSYARRPFHRLSGGEQKRVLLARGLAQDTDLLLLDEPTNHLDIKYQHALMRTVRSLDRTVVVALHDLDLALTYFDLVGVLHEGGLMAFGPPQEILTEELVGTAFGIPAVTVRHPVTGRRHMLFG
jgi:iron complex transport system ATP-binding protein